jgi:hypothetical protein
LRNKDAFSVLREAATAASKRAASQKVAAVLGKHFEGLLEAERLAKAKVRKRSFTANCIIIDHFLHLNRDWSPRFSTLRDKNGWVWAKTA